MARIRSIKPEFWAHEGLARVSRDARLLFVGLWTVADDEGRLRGAPRFIHGQVFPYDDDADVPALLGELERGGFIRRYEAEGQSYVFIPGFRNHQKIDKPSKSKLPGPPASPPETLANPREAESRDSGRIAQEQGAGSGAGKGREQATAAAAPEPSPLLTALGPDPEEPDEPKSTAEDAAAIAKLESDWDPKLVAAVHDALKATRASGRMSSGPWLGFLRRASQYSRGRREAAAQTYLDRALAAQGKAEAYLVAMMANGAGIETPRQSNLITAPRPGAGPPRASGIVPANTRDEHLAEAAAEAARRRP